MVHFIRRRNPKFARRLSYCAIALMAFSISGFSVKAAETSTYKYDALGRLIETKTTDGPNNNTNTNVEYDKASNRTNYRVTGSTDTSPPQNPPPPSALKVIVLPINGYTIIPIN